MELLQNVLGENGITIWKKANGIDNTPVEPYTEQKSMSTEETFEQDTIDITLLKNILIAMSEKLCFRLRSENKLTACVTVKIRYSNFDTHTMQCRIPYTSCDHTIIARVKELFDKVFTTAPADHGSSASVQPPRRRRHQVNMFEDSEHIINLYQAMDKMRLRFGEDKIHRAAAMSFSPKRI
jgi:DNA polymerase-4